MSKERQGEVLRYAVFSTSLGWMGVIASPRGLLWVERPHPSRAEAEKQLLVFNKETAEDPHGLAPTVARLKRWLEGEAVEFPEPLDLSLGTPFQQEVWRILARIPRGDTRSYRWVAEQIGRPRAARAVGQAIGANSLPIVLPCHRVVGSDGSLTGFGWGLELKERLLALDRGQT